MSDKRISELVELTSLAADDELPVVDSSANATKRVTYDTLATEVRTETTTLNLGDSTAISSLGADAYRLTADATSNGTLTAWERVDDQSNVRVGSGVTVYSGVFTFPSTGYWLVSCMWFSKTVSGDNFVIVNAELPGTNRVATIEPGIFPSDQVQSTNAMVFLLDVDDTSTTTLKFVASNLTGGSFKGRTDENTSAVTFLRVGDR